MILRKGYSSLHIYIISLASDITRRQKIESLLVGSNLSYEFVDAVYGKDLTETQLSSLNLQSVQIRLKRNLALSEIGCTLSHLKAFKDIVHKNIQWACILEDDAIFDSAFIDFIHRVKSYQDLKTSNLYMLGGQDGLPASKFIAKSFFSKVVLGGSVFHKTILSHQYIFRTCCYLINIDMARSLLNLSNKEFFVADDWFFFHKLGIVDDIYLSDLVNHPVDLSTSHIENDRLISFSNVNVVQSINFKFRLKRKLNFLTKKCVSFLKRFLF